MSVTRVTMLGDSLIAGYGLRRDEALPARLERELQALGHSVVMTNAGVSGDTTADGLRRMHRAVPSDTGLCLVALGANDMMQLIAPDRVRANLDAILTRLASQAIPAMICGMRAPPWFGAYAVSFDGLFRSLATQHQVALDPFLLEGIALNPSYALPDRMHPNARGVQRIAHRLAPRVASELQRLKVSP